MKRENFNLIINTLDDRALYHEICRKIREINATSFRLLCQIPIFSGLSVLTLCSLAENFSSLTLVMTGLFGAMITLFIFRWHKRNIQIENIFRGYAEILEAKKIEMENENQSDQTFTGGPYSMLGHQDRPKDLDLFQSLNRWGRTEAETAVYSATIIFWLLLPVLVLLG